MALKPNLPDSLLEQKEYCFNCGKILDNDAKGVKVIIESLNRDENVIALESEAKYFCERCMKEGICLTMRETGDAP